MKNKRIIVSFDDFYLHTSNKDSRLSRINDFRENIFAVKLGPTSFDAYDILHITNFPILYDHQKLADTPETIEKIVRKMSCKLQENKDGIIMLGYVGSKSIETFINKCKEKNLNSYIVVKMSHEKSDEFLKEDAAEKICEVSLNLGANGIICPVWDFELIKKCRQMIDERKTTTTLATLNSTDLKIARLITVGLRDPETAKKAVDCGADYIITGTYFFNSSKEDLEKLLSL